MRTSHCSQPRPLTVRLGLAVVAAVLLLGSSGCMYRMAIQQGNYLDPTQIDQLQTGMTRSQVLFLLGTPMVPTAFDNDRWDYYYYLKGKPLKEPLQQRLTVYFENDTVSRVDRPANLESPPATPTERS